jgi:nicotinate-nucleotide pyrophosphorylase (carboxylating)
MRDLNAIPLPALFAHFAATGLVRRVLELARDEDLGLPGAGGGDVTSTACFSGGERGVARIVARSGGVVSGLEAIPELLGVFGAAVEFRAESADGAEVGSGTVLASMRGPLRDLLALERTALNMIGRLSGIATLTARFVEAMGRGHAAALYDTRKTTPGMRVLEKYAVRCGGGRCHRLGLFDAVLIKDNHLAGVPLAGLAEWVAVAAARARATRPELAFVEVEVDSLPQLERVLSLKPGVVDIVLLDNLEPGALRAAVQMRNAGRSRPLLEASGGVRLETVRAIAMTGVERISAGALTHGAAGLDVAMDLVGASG